MVKKMTRAALGKPMEKPYFRFDTERGPRHTRPTPKRLTDAQKKVLLDTANIPEKYKALKTADASGQTDADRLLQALDAGIAEFTGRGLSTTANGPIHEQALALAKAAEAFQKIIQNTDPMARDLIDAAIYGASISRGNAKAISQATRYAISWHSGMELDGLAAEAADISAKHPTYRTGNRSLLSHIWDMLSDVRAQKGSEVLPVDKNNRPDRLNARVFADDCVRHLTWALGKRLPKTDWPVILVGKAAVLLGLAVGVNEDGEKLPKVDGSEVKFLALGRDMVFSAIDEWDPMKRADRYPNEVDRAA